MKILLVEPPKSKITIGGEDVFLFELYRLYRRAIPAGKQLAQLRRFPLREIPDLLRRSRRTLGRRRSAHLDYH